MRLSRISVAYAQGSWLRTNSCKFLWRKSQQMQLYMKSNYLCSEIGQYLRRGLMQKIIASSSQHSSFFPAQISNRVKCERSPDNLLHAKVFKVQRVLMILVDWKMQEGRGSITQLSYGVVGNQLLIYMLQIIKLMNML